MSSETRATNHLLALVADKPGLSGRELWQRLEPRPGTWSVFDATTILLYHSLRPRNRIRCKATRGEWRFWPA